MGAGNSKESGVVARASKTKTEVKPKANPTKKAKPTKKPAMKKAKVEAQPVVAFGAARKHKPAK